MQNSLSKSRLLAACAILSVALGVSACGPRMYAGGNKVLAENLERIQPGELSKSQVQRILGTPSSTSLYGQETWLYISRTEEAVAFFKPEETSRQIIAITFNKDDMVDSVREYSQKDGRQVMVSEKKTPTAGHDMGVLEQIIGNIGRFSNEVK
jgi:outer membrane protein assembly factor BamE (lipoprotein component of BamABCDE complex)